MNINRRSSFEDTKFYLALKRFLFNQNNSDLVDFRVRDQTLDVHLNGYCVSYYVKDGEKGLTEMLCVDHDDKVKLVVNLTTGRVEESDKHNPLVICLKRKGYVKRRSFYSGNTARFLEDLLYFSYFL